MGQFSWLYSDTGAQMLDNVRADSYLLIPPEFQNKYGKFILETCYDGYGHIGTYDVYDLVAEWNREFLCEDMLKRHVPQRERYGKCPWDDENLTEEQCRELHYAEAVKRYENMVKNVLAYKGTGKTLSEDFPQREVGIYIACHDEQNAALPYPIKITSKLLPYEEVLPSLSDPNQGWAKEDGED